MTNKILKNKSNSEESHSVEDVYNLLLKMEKTIKEFKLTAADLEMRMQDVEKDILYLKIDALPNFINRIITNIDEIKDRVDDDFVDLIDGNKKSFENLSLKNEKDFNNFSNRLDGKVVAPITSFEELLGDIKDLSNQIIEILEKKK